MAHDLIIARFSATLNSAILERNASDKSISLSPITGCHDGWISFKGNCYFFGTDAMRFAEAEHYCQQHGSHVVEVFNSLENDFLKDLLNKSFGPTYVWLGLTDEVTEGTWRWYNSQTSLNFTDFVAGDSVHASQDCAVFYKPYGYRWGDITCTYDAIPLCKQRSTGCFSEIVG